MICADFLGDARLLGREDRLDVAAADHLAHGALRHRLDGALRVLEVEHVVLRPRGVDLPDHVEIDVDDVLVGREHQALFGDVAGSALARRRAVADLDALLRRDVRLLDLADRVRQVVAQALAGRCPYSAPKIMLMPTSFGRTV